MIGARARRLVEKAWHRAPADTFDDLVSRLRRTPRDWWRTRYTVWNHLPYYLHMFVRLVERAGLGRFEADGKRVLELGCGPVLGFLPLLVLEGARSVAAAEPALVNPAVNRGYQEHYLRSLWQMHGAVCGSAQSFDAFVVTLEQLMVKPDTPSFDKEGTLFDLVVSKSCLEHVRDLPETVASLKGVSAPGALHAHYIDFTLHWQFNRRDGPFGDLYSRARGDSPEAYGQPHGHLNLLRPGEVEALFRRHFDHVKFVPLMCANVNKAVHTDWQRHPHRSLEVENAIVVAR